MFIINPYIYATGGGSFVNDYSMIFDGVNEYVQCDTITELSNVGSFSISLWVKHTSLPATNRALRLYTSSTAWIEIMTNSGQGLLVVSNGSTTYGTFPASTFTTGTWQHLVMVFDGSGGTNADKLKGYVDNSNKTLTFTGTIPSTTATYTTEKFDIGRGFNGGSYFNGSIDEVSIFDYALDSSQVSSLYNSGSPTDLDATSGVTAPVHWWRMGDGSDTISTINDVGTGTAKDGTPTNMESGDIQLDTP